MPGDTAELRESRSTSAHWKGMDMYRYIMTGIPVVPVPLHTGIKYAVPYPIYWYNYMVLQVP